MPDSEEPDSPRTTCFHGIAVVGGSDSPTSSLWNAVVSYMQELQVHHPVVKIDEKNTPSLYDWIPTVQSRPLLISVKDGKRLEYLSGIPAFHAIKELVEDPRLSETRSTDIISDF